MSNDDVYRLRCGAVDSGPIRSSARSIWARPFRSLPDWRRGTGWFPCGGDTPEAHRADMAQVQGMLGHWERALAA